MRTKVNQQLVLFKCEYITGYKYKNKQKRL